MSNEVQKKLQGYTQSSFILQPLIKDGNWKKISA